MDEAQTIVTDEGDNNERGGIEENLEQPMLSPTVDHGAPS